MNIQEKTETIYNNCKELKSYDADSHIEITNTEDAYLIQDGLLD